MNLLSPLHKAKISALDNPLEFAEILCAVSQALATFEALDPAERRRGGINDWTHSRLSRSTERSLRDILSGERFVQFALVTRLGACVLLVTARRSDVRKWADLYVTLSHIALGRHTINGADGADQLSAVTHAAAFLGRTDNARNKDLAIAFIGSQVVLSYFASGFTKIFGSEWINGTALERIMRTHTYGDERFYRFLRDHPFVGEWLTRHTVVIETAFPILLLNRHTRAGALVTMGGFHLANAKLMGLGRFLLSFVAAYPSIIHMTGNRP